MPPPLGTHHSAGPLRAHGRQMPFCGPVCHDVRLPRRMRCAFAPSAPLVPTAAMTTDHLVVPPSAVAVLAETIWHDAMVAPLNVPGATSVRFDTDDYARIGERLELLIEHLPDAWSTPLIPL